MVAVEAAVMALEPQVLMAALELVVQVELAIRLGLTQHKQV